MRRRLPIAVFASSLIIAATAIAVPPTQERIPIDDAFPIPAGDLCDFAVDLTATGKVLITTHYRKDGTVDFISERPNIQITVTNPATGLSFRDSDVGLDKRDFKPDGTSDVLSTGIHSKIRTKGGGVIFRRIGLQIIHLDAKGNVVSVEIKGGNFDPDDAFAETVCAAID